VVAHAEDPPAFLLKWGSLGSGDDQFVSGPGNVAVDPQGNVFVEAGRTQKFTGQGAFLLKWDASGAIDIDPNGVAYLLSGSTLQKFTGTGVFLGQWSGVGVLGAIAVDPTAQYVYVVGANVVIQYTTDGGFVREWITVNSSQARNTGVAVGPSGNVYVVEGGTADRVYKYTPDGVLITSWGGRGSGDGQFSSPHGVAVDADENVYVVDSNNARIEKFTSSGVFLTKWGSVGSGDGQFLGAADIAVDGDGNIYVVDSFLNRVQKFGTVPTSTRTTTWGRIKALYRGTTTAGR